MANEFRHTGFSSKADREGEKKMAIEMKKVTHTVNDRAISRFAMVDRDNGEAVGALGPIVQGGKVVAYRCVYWGDLKDGFHDQTVVRKKKGETTNALIKRAWRAAYELTPNGYW